MNAFFGHIKTGALVLLSSDDGAFDGIVVGSHGPAEADLREFLEACAPTYRAGSSRPAKIIGFSAAATKAEQVLRQMGFSLDPARTRPCPFDVVYDAKSRKLRASGDEKIRVLVVDDSKSVRLALKKAIDLNPDMLVCGESEDAGSVPDLLDKLNPDCMTLDINMPDMNGVDLLKALGASRIPKTLIVSSLRKETSPLIFDALEQGAIDYYHKAERFDLESLSKEMGERIRGVANAQLRRNAYVRPVGGLLVKPMTALPDLIAIGSSTGGTEALKVLLTKLPRNIPPIVIAQHIPAVFSAAFAERMNSLCPFRVQEGSHGQVLEHGNVYVAPGSRQMRIIRNGGKLTIDIDDNAAGENYNPSVNNLFRSIAACKPPRCVAVILTGMGRDGTDGLAVMKRDLKEVVAIAQDEESSVVWGMPGEATKSGKVDYVFDINVIPLALAKLINSVADKSA